jgi:DNA-binding response OmpR family regulator
MMDAPLPHPDAAVETTSILFVDSYAAGLFVPSLRTHAEVTAVLSEDQAGRALSTIRPALVVTELELPEGDGVAVCRRAKALGPNPPSVLVTTARVDLVPDALAAGCDGVLLKPFVPNLLYARIGRLLRQRARALHEKMMWQRADSVFQIEHSQAVTNGTNVVRPDTPCPSCGQGGAVSFDAAGYRRLWYACLSCRHVWLGPRGEGWRLDVPSALAAAAGERIEILLGEEGRAG